MILHPQVVLNGRNLWQIKVSLKDTLYKFQKLLIFCSITFVHLLVDWHQFQVFRSNPTIFTRCNISPLNPSSAHNAILFLWIFKNMKILFSCGWPGPLITTSTCSELWRRFRTCEFRRDSSCLFYPCKFSFVVHTKCWKKYSEWTTKLNLQR